MPWLLVLFRCIAAWMRASKLVTGDTKEDRRVFLQAFVALGGVALLDSVADVPGNRVVAWHALHEDAEVFYFDTETAADRPDAMMPFTLEDVRAAVEKLREANVPAFPGGFYRCFTPSGPGEVFLRNDVEFIRKGS